MVSKQTDALLLAEIKTLFQKLDYNQDGFLDESKLAILMEPSN